jgi:hypothetical protein
VGQARQDDRRSHDPGRPAPGRPVSVHLQRFHRQPAGHRQRPAGLLDGGVGRRRAPRSRSRTAWPPRSGRCP